MVVPVDSQNGVRQYVWNNTTTEFSYPYIITSDSLFATLYESNGAVVLEIPSTAYTLSDETRSSGILTITDSGVLATEADYIILERIETLDQELDLGKYDFPPEAVEDAFDKSRIIDQQQQALTNRGVITNIVEGREEPIELPVAVEGLFLAWDEEGNLKNATSTGTSLPAVADTYLKRNNANDAFTSLTVEEVKEDLEVPDELVITDGNYIRGTGTGFEEVTSGELSDDIGAQSELEVFHVREEQASGTNGSGSTGLTQQTRVLNTVVTNNITGASLSSNQITLPTGNYIVRFSAPAFRVDGHRAVLYDITNTANILLGSSEYAYLASLSSTSSSTGFGYFELTGSTVIELQHYTESTNTVAALGRAVSSGDNEVYAEVIITKIG